MPFRISKWATVSWARVARRAAVLVVAVAVLYVAALNVFLRTHLLGSLTDKAGRSFHLEYARAYAFVPWRVHAEGVKIRSGDDHVEWALTVDRVDFDPHLVRLIRRRFKASDIHADGVTFRIRLLQERASPAHDDFVASIEGFDDPPLRPIGPSIMVTDQNYDLFSVELEGVDARHVREIWIDTARFTGDVHVLGRWLFRPLRLLDVGPVSVDVATLAVGHGQGEAFITDVAGHFDATIPPFDVRTADGLGILRHVSLRTDLAGTLLTPNIVQEFAGKSGLAMPSGNGTFDIKARIERGVLQPSSTTRIELPRVRLMQGGFSGDGTVAAQGRVEAGDAGGRSTGVVDVTVTQANATAPTGPLASAETVHAALTTHDLDLVDPFGEVEYAVECVDLTTPRIDALAALITKDASLTSGRARADAHLSGSLTQETAHGDLDVRVDRLAYGHASLQAGGDLTAHLALRAADVRANTADLGGSVVRVNHAHARSGELTMSLPAVSVTLPALTIDHAAAKGVVDAEETGALAETRGVGVWGDAKAHAESWAIDWGSKRPKVTLGPTKAAIASLVARRSANVTSDILARSSLLEASTSGLTLDANGATGNVSFNVPSLEVLHLGELARWVPWPKSFAVQDGVATAVARGDIGLGPVSLAATAHVDARALRVRAGTELVTGDAKVDLVAQRSPGDTTTRLTGTRVAIEHVVGGGAKEWWAQAVLGDSAIRQAGDGWRGRFRARFAAKDATPAEPMISQASGVPKWVLGLVSLPNVEADGEVAFSPGKLDIRGLEVRGGHSSVHLELADAPANNRGLVLVELGVLRAGFGLGNETPKIILADAASWFEAQRQVLERDRASYQTFALLSPRPPRGEIPLARDPRP
jgi:hypothetical protein